MEVTVPPDVDCSPADEEDRIACNAGRHDVHDEFPIANLSILHSPEQDLEIPL